MSGKMSKLLKEVFDRSGKVKQMKPILATKEDIEKRNNQIKIPRLDAQWVKKMIDVKKTIENSKRQVGILKTLCRNHFR